MRKIIIIGCSGSGKTTLAHKISEKLNLPLVHLDKLYWTSDWQHLSEAEFDAVLENELHKDSWVIDGNYQRTMKKRFELCDTCIWLDFPRHTCIFGVIKRVLSNYGKTRADMGDNCPERFDLSFLKWIWDFNRKTRYKITEIIKTADQYQHIYILKSRKDISDFLKQLEE